MRFTTYCINVWRCPANRSLMIGFCPFVDVLFVVDPPLSGDGGHIAIDSELFELFSFLPGAGVEVFVCSSIVGLFQAVEHRNHQQKNTLRQIRRRCALTQATSLLRSLRPVRPEFRCNARKHPVLPVLPGNALYLLTRRRVLLTPWLHLSSGSLHFLLMMAPASHCLFRAP